VSRQARVIYWLVAIAAFGFVMWFLGGVLAPFIFAGVLAYLLDPLADRLERLGMGRTWAALVIVLLAGLVIFGAIVAVVPLLVSQLGSLVGNLPETVATARDWLEARLPFLTGNQNFVQDALARAEQTVREQAGTVWQGVVASTAWVFNLMIFLGIAPIVTFFLLVDWDGMVAKVDGWLPRDQVGTIRRLASEVDDVLAGFIRGQLTVAMIMGVYYATVLTVVGLPYGYVVGVVAGIGTIVPFVGAAIGAGLAMGIAIFSFWGDWAQIALVAAVYFGGQLVEGNVLTPKLVGQHVGLHPVWLLLGFSVFGSLFGFVGVLVAAPLAAVVGVLARFAIERYLASPLYHGDEGTAGEGWR
jgi:predicted PurR-regulated permease PerM